MQRTVLIVALLLALSGISAAWRPKGLLGGAMDPPVQHHKHHKQPKFCGDKECPRFRLVQKYKGFELRTYKKQHHAFTKVSTDDGFAKAYVEGVARLAAFFGGANDRNQTLDVTTPTLVIVPISTQHHPDPPNEIELSWVIPRAQQKDPPSPTNRDVEVSFVPQQSFAVKSFEGFATEDRIHSELEPFYDTLFNHETIMLVRARNIGVAVYSPPTQLIHRYNELLVPISLQIEDDDDWRDQ